MTGKNALANPYGLPTWARTASGVQFADFPVQPRGRMPDFCIIGAAKCGTTSLNDYLAQHPAIFMNPLKEPNYFSTDAHLARGDEWYMGQYAAAADDQICGEASTSYSRHPVCIGTAARIAEANPNMKLIYVVRSPVKRIQSECLQKMKHALHVQKIDLTSLSVDEMLDLAEDPTSSVYLAPIATSQYREQLREYESHFPREQILVVIYEVFAARPREVLNAILEFLCVDTNVTINMNARHNVTSRFTRNLARERLKKRLTHLPGFQTIQHVIPRNFRSNLADIIARNGNDTQFSLSPSRIKELEEHFTTHICQLEEWIGHEIIEWHNSEN